MSEVQKAVDGLSKAFEDFKAANDERLKEIEKKGSVDVVLDEKVDRINNAVSELQTKAKELEDSSKQRMDEIETILNRPGGGAKGVDERETAAEFFSMMNGEPVTPDNADVESFRQYKQAFSTYLRRGSSSQDVRNAMSVGEDPQGGYWVEPTTLSRIIQKIFDTSPVRSVAQVISIGSDAVEFPNDVNDGTSGGWVGERASRSDTDTPEVGMQRIPVHEQYAQPKVTQKLLDDAQFPVEAWLSDKIADKLSRTENTAFVSGTGVTQPRGFLDYKADSVTTDDDTRSWGVLQYVASGAAGGFPNVSGINADDPGTLIDLISKLHPNYRQGAVFAMNRTTEATIRKLKDNDGRYLVGMGDIQDGLSFNLHGFRIVNMEDMPDIASNSYSIAFGNFGAGYLVVDRVGIRVLRDPYTNKPYIRYYTTKRVGGDVINFDAIKLMKFAAS